jgi:hypothetical protein
MRKSVLGFGIAAVGFFSSAASAQEVSLFDQAGKPQAYIALDEEMTIYLWGGTPVAYLKSGDEGGYDVYGFNGKHIGWFVSGVIWDHQGDASCATESRLQNTEYEPYKSYKHYKPYKSYTEYAPYRPRFSDKFGDAPCQFLLASGGK